MIIEMLDELNEKKKEAESELAFAKANSKQNEIESMIWDQINKDLKSLLKYSNELDTGIADPNLNNAHVVLVYFDVTDSFCIMPMYLNDHTGEFKPAGSPYGLLEKRCLLSGFKERPDSIQYKISNALCNWDEAIKEIEKNVVQKLKIETSFLQKQTAEIKKVEKLAKEVEEKIAVAM